MPSTPTFAEACAAVCGPGARFEIAEADVNGLSTRVFAHAPKNIRELFARAAERTDDFVIYEDERWTMPQVLGQAAQIGAALVDTYGITNGDRVAIAMRNFPEWISSFVAITSIGAIAVPLNAWWKTDELVFGLADSGSKVVIADEDRVGRMAAAKPGSIDASIIVVRARGAVPDGVARLEDVIVEGAAMPDIEIAADDDVTILYTSGTTGNPKGAVSTHRALLNALIAFAARSAVSTICNPPDPDLVEYPKSVMLPVPLFHVTGLVPAMLGTFLSGARVVLTHRWDPDRALELIERERVTSFIGVPTMTRDLLEAPTFADRDTSSLTSISGGGAPMPPELVKAIDDSFSTGRPGLGYGMTETNAYGPQNSGKDFLDNPTSTGRPIPIMQVRVTDPVGAVLPTGETGEIWFAGPNLIRCYWNQPQATAETLVDGWLRTGDIGRIDEDGFVYISDRAKDMVLRGGENIYCSEVEASIYEHPAVYECAVYGVPDDRLGEAVAAHVMVRAGATLTADDLQRFLGERIADFKIPTVITLVGDPLPRNASGKILKRELRDVGRLIACDDERSGLTPRVASNLLALSHLQRVSSRTDAPHACERLP